MAVPMALFAEGQPDQGSPFPSPFRALWAWVSPASERLTRTRMGARAYRVCAPLAAILPAPHNNLRGLRPLLVPPLKMGSVGLIIDYNNIL
jgi:hypothetical protein